jgi:cellulose synthase (UDP-forming)
VARELLWPLAIMGPRPPGLGNRSARRAFRILSILTAATTVSVGAYLAFRLATFSLSAGDAADRVMAGLLLLAELFLAYHAAGFFLAVARSTRARAQDPDTSFAPHSATAVAVLVASYNEAEDVLEETLAALAGLDYAPLRVYLVDDSTKEGSRQAAERLCARYGATLVRRPHRTGFKAGAINELLPRLPEPYVAVLDADQRPLRHWLKEVVPLLDVDPRLAFVQVPQIYVNGEGLPVARSTQAQQAVFFQYICEGKAVVNAMFCCGSNVVFRRDALLSIGVVREGRQEFFDESSVTEDFATTVSLHAAGWRTAYVNRPLVLGMGPETLPAYFTQQMRWAMGTLGVGLRLLRRLVREPRALRPLQWWEYLLSGTYYFSGLANLVFILAPPLFLAFDVRPVRLAGDVYLLLAFPQIAFNMGAYLVAMRLRGVGVRSAWLASALSFSTFWTYTKAALVALFGLKRAFGVTPKGVGGRVPLRSLVPELLAFVASATSVAVALACMAILGPQLPYLVNGAWALYNAAQLATLFVHFNRPVAIRARPEVFRPLAASSLAGDALGR